MEAIVHIILSYMCSIIKPQRVFFQQLFSVLMAFLSLLESQRYTHINASLTALNLLKIEDRLEKQTKAHS